MNTTVFWVFSLSILAAPAVRAAKYGGTMSWRIVDSKDEDHTDGQGALAAMKLLEENHPAKTGKPCFLADLCGLPFARTPQRQTRH